MKSTIALFQILILLSTDIVPTYPIADGGCGNRCMCSVKTQKSGSCCCLRAKQSASGDDRSGSARSCCAHRKTPTHQPDSGDAPHDDSELSVAACNCEAHSKAMVVVPPPRTRADLVAICNADGPLDAIVTFNEHVSGHPDPPDPFPPDSDAS